MRLFLELMQRRELHGLSCDWETLCERYVGSENYFFLEAMQMIDFTLSRTGVILRSEARMLPTLSGPDPREQIIEPRHFDFDRPFLIYVKKRGGDYSPFFVMWVDNAEFMESFSSSE
jgi:hypothetical protein